MSKCFKKIFAITIALAILIACIPTVSVFAETLGGTCGENVNWSLDTDTGVLTISGSGDMDDYDWNNIAPWDSTSSYIKSVSIENGITSIGDAAFRGCSSLSSITIPDSVKSIGSSAFSYCSSLTAINVGGGNQSILYRMAFCLIKIKQN